MDWVSPANVNVLLCLRVCSNVIVGGGIEVENEKGLGFSSLKLFTVLGDQSGVK